MAYRFTKSDELQVQPLKWASSSTFNAICGMLHFGSGIFILIEDRLSPFIEVSSEVQIQRFALNVDPGAKPWSLELVDAGSVRVFLLIASFLLITGCVHFFYAWRQLRYQDTPGVWFRYIEYSVTASIMTVIIALLLGIREVYLLVLLAVLTSITMIYGSIQDRLAIPIDEWAVNPAVFIAYPLWAFLMVFGVFLLTAMLEIWENDLVDHFLVVHLRSPMSYLSVEVVDADWTLKINTFAENVDIIYPIVMAVVVTVGYRVYNWVTGNYGMWLSEFVIVGSHVWFIFLVLAGITDVYFLTLLISLLPTTGTFVYIYRKLRDDGVSAEWPVSPHFLGYVPYCAVWAVLLTYYAISIRENDENPPWYVNVIVFAEFALFSSFALVQYYYVVWPLWRSGSSQYEPLDDDNITKMDGAYNILSVVAKLLLCWVTFGGIAGQAAV